MSETVTNLAANNRRNPWPAAEQGQWHRIAPSYMLIDLATNLIFAGVVLAIMFAPPTSQFLHNIGPWSFYLLGGLAGIAVLSGIFSFWRTRSMGYMLRADDFVFIRGFIFKRIIAIPYGRLQLVDIERGPLLRAFGLSQLKFVTAAVGLSIKLPGIREAEAERLRDTLIEMAETRRSGM